MGGRPWALTMVLALFLAGCGIEAAPSTPGGPSGPPASGTSGAPAPGQGKAGGAPSSPVEPARPPSGAGQGGSTGSVGTSPQDAKGGPVPGLGQQGPASDGRAAVYSQDFVPASQLTMEALKQRKNLWIDCNLSQQRVYIKDGDQVLKVMMTSSGLDTSPDTSTPRGTFHIGQRDTWFYNAQEQEGGMYWVSFKGLEFLFHSVPMNQNQQVIQSEAEKLGQKASHGCLRLAVPDAKWFYDNIPPGTKVVIHD